MKMHTLMHIPYLHGRVEGIDNEKLAHTCITEGVRYTEDPIETRFEDFEIPSNEEWNKVFENIQHQFMNGPSGTLELMDYWAQVHKKYESTNMHNHFNILAPNETPDTSGVYYVQIPKGSGSLVFDYNINQYVTNRYSIEPIVGNFLIFPSTLNHYVTKNLSDDLRVAISFNAKVNNSK